MFFFDFDGMLIDLVVGIICCVVYVFIVLDWLVLLEEEFWCWIGLLLCISFVLLFDDLVQVEQVVVFYCECFEVFGWEEYVVYLQIGQVVQVLYEWGYWLVIVIVKNELYVCCIIEYLLFGGCFEDVIGVILDGSCSEKLQLVVEVFWCLLWVLEQCWMIGDWCMDIVGVCYYVMCNIGVLWGFGGVDELCDVGVQYIVVLLEVLLLLID